MPGENQPMGQRVGSILRGIATFFYNRQEGTVMGRNAKGWFLLLVFYVFYYGTVAALTAIGWHVFLVTVDPLIPTYQQGLSAIGTNPGLTFRPASRIDEQTFIKLDGSNKTTYLEWIENLDKFLDKYYTSSELENNSSVTKQCSYEDFPEEDEVCDVDVKAWGNCTRERFFDYKLNAPCIFVKLNKIYGWVPEYYSEIEELPEDMPLQLKYHIGNTTENKRKTIWITCAGEQEADEENLGPVVYYPAVQGFPGYYYPYKNLKGYLNPLVAVQFLKPATGVTINIVCKAWAKNIVRRMKDSSGYIRFELRID